MARRTLTVLLTLLAWGGAPAAPQKPAEKPGPPPALTTGFGETIEVNVVNVEVFVTDRKGKRVNGLTKDDFELLEDGRPMPITNFYAVQSGKAVEERGAETIEAIPTPQAPALPPGLQDAASAIPEDQQLHLVVYVDNFNIRPQNRNRVFRSVREFLTRQLRVGDQVMLASYDRSLHVRRSFTGDPLVIASALFELETVSGFGGQADSDRRQALSDIRDAQDSAFALARARQYAEAVANDQNFTIEAIKEVVGALAGLPGRKAILYVCDGIPMVAGEDLFHAVDEKFRESGVSLLESRSYDFTRRFRELTAQANANRVTFYTLDSAGLRGPSGISAEERDSGNTGMVDNINVSNLQATLQTLAFETGGRAILNSNDPTLPLQAVAEDFQTYYSLGYSPGHGGTGRYHEIKVKVKGKGLTVRHREGYRDKPPEQRMGDGIRSALYFDKASNPLGITVAVDEQNLRSDGNYTVVVVVRIPIGKLVLVPEGEARQVARVRVYVSAMDEDGRMSDVQQAPVPIVIPTEEVATAVEKLFAYSVPLVMRPGPHKLAVGVRDDVAANGSYNLTYFTVGRR